MSKRTPHRPQPPPPNTARPWASPRLRLGFVALVAVAVRGTYYLQYRRSPLAGYHIVDQSYYLDWARRIAGGDWWGREVFEQGPLYPYLLGAALATVGERLNLLLILQLGAGIGTVLLTYGAARRLFDEPTALVAGLAAAVYGPLLFYECMVLKSFLEPACTVASLYGLLRFQDSGRWRWLCGAGVAIGLACLLRESHLLLAIPAALAAAFGPSPATGPRTGRQRLLTVAVLAASVALPVLPVSLRNYRVGSELVWVTAGGGEVFYMGHGPSATGYYSPPDFITARPPREHEDFRREAQRRMGQALSRGESSRFWFREGLRAIAADPLRTLRLTIVKASVLLNDFEVPDSESYELSRQFVPVLRVLPSFAWIAGCGLLGFVVCLRDWQRYGLLLGFVVAYALPVLLLYNFGRFRLGLMPLWIVLAAHGAVWLVREWKTPSSAGRRRAVPATILVAAATLIAFLKPLGYEQMNYRLGTALLRGSLYRRADQPAQAEQAFREALHLAEEQYSARQPSVGGSSPAARKVAEAHLELASLYRSQDKLPDSLAHYQQAVAVQPDSLEGHFNLANLLVEIGERDAALEQYRLALQIRPDDVDTIINFGGTLLAAGRLEEAVVQLEHAEAIEPRNAQANYNLANALLMQGHAQRAILHYRLALEVDPQNADIHNNLGQALARLPQLPAAEAAFRAALGIDADHANAQLNLARVLDAQGQRQEAATHYRRALRLFPPSSPQAQAIERRLRELENR